MPACLVFTVLASAVRFSDSEYFSGSKQEAIDGYAREAWLSVLRDHMTVENCPNLHVAQASNMLAVIDFTGKWKASAIPSFSSLTMILGNSWSDKFRMAEDRPRCSYCPGFRTHERA